jgi:hypothetical protein
MRFFLGVGVVGALVTSFWSECSHADMTAFVTTSQSLQQRPAGSSTHSLLDDISGQAHPYSFTLFSIFSGPTVSNLDSEPSVAISAHGKRLSVPTGYSVRHQATFGYHLSENWVLGPVLDFSDSFYGPTSGQLTMGDAQLRITRLNAFEGRIGANDVKVHLMFGSSAPTSQNAHDLHGQGGVSETLIARMNIRDSRWSLGGTAGARTSFYDQGAFAQVTKLSSGLEASYHHNQYLSSFFMPTIGDSIGPKIDMTTKTNLLGAIQTHIFGVTVGARIRATDAISISPIINWFTDSPLSNSTIGLTTSIQLI